MNRAIFRPAWKPRNGSSGRRWATLAVGGVAVAVGGVAVAILAGGRAGSSAPLAEASARGHSRIQEERPPRPQPPYDVAPRSLESRQAQERRAQQRARTEARRQAQETGAGNEDGQARAGGSSIPPASAGTNGSFTPSPAAGRRTITPRTMAGVEQRPASESAILLDGVALAPPSAPEAIKAAITAANSIIGRPYVWGGGHASWYSRGYDCSGAVSYALGGGGFIRAPLNSSQLMSFGVPGTGRWLTVYANPSHAYAVIAGLRWDTVGDAKGSGPRWHPALPYPQGFVARHPPGY